jgi:hypothetical protein
VGVGVVELRTEAGERFPRASYALCVGALNLGLQRGAHFLDTCTRKRFRNGYRLQAGSHRQRASRHIVVISGPLGGLN